MKEESYFVIKNNKLEKFIGCKDTEIIYIPYGVQSIEENALSHLNVREIFIPSTVNEIKSKACAYNKNLTTIYVDSVSANISTDWINSCPSLSNLAGERYKDRTYDNGMVYVPHKRYRELEWCPHTLEGNVVLPKEIRVIQKNAFAQCSKITELKLSERIRIIDNDIFKGLSSLKEITLGRYVKEVEPRTFRSLKSLENINVHPKNTVYETRNHALFETEYNSLEVLPRGIEGTYRIPDKTNWICKAALVDSKINKFIVPKGLSLTDCEIGIFTHCNKLTAIEFENPRAKLQVKFFALKNDVENPNLKIIYNMLPNLLPKHIFTDMRKLLEKDIISGITTDSEFSEEWKNEWLDFFRRNRKTYYGQMLETPAFLKVMMDHKFLTISDIQKMMNLLEEDKSIDLKAILLDYLHANFSNDSLIKNKEKELFSNPYSVDKMQKLWNWSTDDDGSITITNYKGFEPNVIVPYEIGNKTVKRIHAKCFSAWGSRVTEDELIFRESRLLSVVFPDSVEIVEDGLFNGCQNLVSVTFPQKLTINTYQTKHSYWNHGFSYSMFGKCNMLSEITIPEGVEKLGDYSFSECENLKEVHLPQTLSSIGRGLFYECKSLEEIEIPANVESLSCECFVSCKSLKKVILHEGLKKIESEAFNGCNNLNEIYIPSSVTSLSYPIINETEEESGITIKGTKGSAAITYAKEHGLLYEIVENSEE